MANKKDFDYIKLFYDIRNVCLTLDHCKKCKEMACLVGYSRWAVANAKKKHTDTLEGWHKDIPSYDINGGYDKQDALEAIAHTLQQCRSCRGEHNCDCLVNIVRTCYEVIVFGDEQHFDGSTLVYLKKLEENYPEEAAVIAEAYREHNNPMEEAL